MTPSRGLRLPPTYTGPEHEAAGLAPIDETVEVRDHDVVLVPHGYHGPCVAAPGYPMYYLNVMAGPGAERELAFCDDPAHGWVRDTWADMAHGPPLPDDLGGGPRSERPTMTARRTVRLTTAQALVRWMIAQRSELLDGTEVPLFAGVFAIFGHGNVLGLGTALHEAATSCPTWRGQNEQGMALAAVAYARATDRRQVMAATSSIGPGALNMVTAAGVAHANRLPVLLLPGDTFTGRAPGPGAAAGRALRRPDDDGQRRLPAGVALLRPDHPARAAARRRCPQVARVLTDPADAGPVVLALPQDVQAEEYDFPVAMFEPRLHRVPRAARRTATRWPAPRRRSAHGRSGRCSSSAAGCATPGAAAEALAFAEAHGVPVVETVAGRTLVPHDHPLYGGALGIIGSTSANTLAAEADVVLAVGTRLQDFTTSSWTGFAGDVRMVTVNAARFDAVKHGAQAVVGDARETLVELDAALGDWAAPAELGRPRAAEEQGRLGRARRRAAAPAAAPDGSLTYAQVDRRRQRRQPARTTTCSPRPAACPASCTAAGAPATVATGRDLRRHDGPRVRLLVHGLRGRRAVGCRDGPRPDPSRTGWSPRSSATAPT